MDKISTSPAFSILLHPTSNFTDHGKGTWKLVIHSFLWDPSIISSGISRSSFSCQYLVTKFSRVGVVNQISLSVNCCDEVCASMDWNPSSLTPTSHHPLHSVSLSVPHHGPPGPIVPLSISGAAALSRAGGASRLGVIPGKEHSDDGDDRRPSTPRNMSPALLSTEYGEDAALDENHDDLLVFGYGCKIFRDDERAKWIEDQKHLIPWMGNADLLIDRYDCRGALMDISRYEPGSRRTNPQESSEDDSENPYEQEYVSEQDLDAERYKELNEDIDYDEGAYDKAADYRRLQNAMNGMLSEAQGGTFDESRNYAAFQYNYDAQSHDICIGPEPKKLHDEDAPYSKPVGLYIPEEIVLPATMKIHAIIEKTAKFIASQGNQMEIILKTKQASNPLFDFLNHGGSLNPYYKFLVHAIRSGIYRPTEQEEAVSTQGSSQSLSSEHSEEDTDHHTYLHPSLFRTSNSSSSGSALSSFDYAMAAVTAPSSTSSKHNAYSMLVSKIKGTDSPDPPTQQTPASTTSAYGVEYSQPTTSNSQAVYSVYGYGSSGQDNPVQAQQKKLPSTSDQLIIEKMASYVIKNGANFEVLAKNKSDPRFGFLNSTHEFHWYYLNCKERFKAESSAVVAKKEFVNYGSSSSINSSSNISSKTGTTTTSSMNPTIKKMIVAAELAEMKRKVSGILAKKEAKDKSGTSGAENVFSHASLVQSKDKEKPVIRFSSSLSVTSASSSSLPATTLPAEPESKKVKNSKSTPQIIYLSQTQPATKSEPQEEKKPVENKSMSVDLNVKAAPTVVDDEEEEGEIRDSDSDISLLDDGGGNSTPASDDEEKVRRRLERKRKAAIFLQKLKMNKNFSSGSTTSSITAGAPLSDDSKASSSLKSATKPVPTTGTSLGDLLVSRRLQGSGDMIAQPEKILRNPNPVVEKVLRNPIPPEITISDSEDNDRASERIEGSGGNDAEFHNSNSSTSSRHSNRERKNHATSSRKRHKRKRSRSYSSSHSPSRSPSSSVSSYESNNHTYSRKKSSKKKRKRKKKKYEKTSRSSHKSKRR